MHEQLWLGLIIGALVGAAIVARVAPRDHRPGAWSRLEAKLDALLEHEGIQFDPYANLPAPVLDALRRGKKIEAIKEYRLATGAGLAEAKEYVEEVQRRGAPPV